MESKTNQAFPNMNPLKIIGEIKCHYLNTFAQTLASGKKSSDIIDFYQYLLSKYTTPAEIFGIQSVKELRENDRFVINPAGKLPQARIAFLDEVFKANSATLNSLLTILNEKQFDDGTGVRKDVPLEMMVGASNEMPEEGEGLEALWDRFVLRQVVVDIERDDSFLSLLTGQGIGKVSCKVDREDVLCLRVLASQVDVSKVLPAFLDLRQAMATAGIRVSGRKWCKAIEVVKAVSALKGRSVASNSDLGVLSAVLWEQPDQIDAIRQMLSQFASDDVKVAMQIADAAREAFQGLERQGDSVTIKALGMTKRILRDLLAKADALDATEDAVCEAIELIKEFQGGIKRLTLGSIGRS